MNLLLLFVCVHTHAGVLIFKVLSLMILASDPWVYFNWMAFKTWKNTRWNQLILWKKPVHKVGCQSGNRVSVALIIEGAGLAMPNWLI